MYPNSDSTTMAEAIIDDNSSTQGIDSVQGNLR